MTDVLRILIAPLVWLAAFSGVYALHGIGCALGWPDIGIGISSLHRVVLVVAWGLAIAAQVAVLGALRAPGLRSASPFVQRIAVTLGVVGLVATLWSLFPVAVASACD